MYILKIMFIYIAVIIYCMSLCVVSDVILPIHFENANNKNFDTATIPKQEIKLDDFFWTGSGDNPPEYLQNTHTEINKGNINNVIVKTETIIATIYMDNDHDTDFICLDCVRNSNESDINYTVADRRYWLLTILSGYYYPPEYSVLEERLTKLYRLAFSRHQFRHFTNINYSRENSTTTIRKRRQTNRTKIFSQSDYQNLDNNNSTTVKNKISYVPINVSTYDDVLENKIFNEKLYTNDNSIQNSNRKRSLIGYQDIKVAIHNVSLIKKDDVQNWMESRYENVHDKKYKWLFINQTELIYSVFINGNPVLATVAVDDIEYVSDDEITNILENIVLMKAEPYLREPQATPLVPANSNNATTYNIISAVTYNPLFITIISITILLFLLLLIMLLLMIRANHKSRTRKKKLCSQQKLLIEHQNTTQGKQHVYPFQSNSTGSLATVIDEMNSRNLNNNKQENLEQERGRKVLLPPIEYMISSKNLQPSGSSETESSGTSDLSIYCPIDKTNLELHTVNNDEKKSSKNFEKKMKKSERRYYNQYKDELSSHISYSADTMYKKKDKKIKQKRKYLSENRVGSIEEIQNNLSDGSISTESISDNIKLNNYDNLSSKQQLNEAYNPNTKYNRNKIFKDHLFTDNKAIYDNINEHNILVAPKEVSNRELIKSFKLDEKSSESCDSIGSFLSMASLKSFPKTVLPQPLHRVLEPTKVIHYDQYDNSYLKSENKQNEKKTDITFHCEINSQSDNPDPGILGPIVWEIHKKNLVNEKTKNSKYDESAASQNRFEGLLESAIELYSTTTENFSQSPTTANNIEDSLSRQKKNRAKSAIIRGNLPCMRKSNSIVGTRPSTADHFLSNFNDFIHTQPPTPNEKAWESKVSSPLIRPLSAGPFHRPEAPLVDMTRVLASQYTDNDQIFAAPLIQAVQTELEKFKRKNTD